jgi:hypothetical protein
VDKLTSSFWQKFRAKISDLHAQQEVNERLIKLEYAAEVQLRAVPESQANMQNAQGVAAIIVALKDEPAAVIQMGPMILVKAPRPDRESAVLCRMLTPQELRILEADPSLLRDPIGLMACLMTQERGEQEEQEHGSVKQERTEFEVGKKNEGRQGEREGMK